MTDNSSTVSTEQPPVAMEMDVAYAYFSVVAVILGVLLTCGVRVIFKLLFFDFFYLPEEEISEQMEKRRRRRGEDAPDDLRLTLHDSVELDMPPTLYLMALQHKRSEQLIT